MYVDTFFSTWQCRYFLALESNKPILMEIRDFPEDNVIFWNVHSTSSDHIHNMMTSISLLGKNKMDIT